MKTYNRKLIPFAQQMRREMTKAERPKPVRCCRKGQEGAVVVWVVAEF
jgi:very-short-patch-repair endonuclease